MIARTATLSRDGVYRYSLGRRWGEDPANLIVWIMLNPSTADDTQDDPTIRRCIGFSKAWGFDALEVVNLFALRTTNPENLWCHNEPFGEENAETIKSTLKRAGSVVCAWGTVRRPSIATPRSDPARVIQELAQLAREDRTRIAPLWRCLGRNKQKSPKHPLRVRRDAILEPWP